MMTTAVRGVYSSRRAQSLRIGVLAAVLTVISAPLCWGLRIAPRDPDRYATPTVNATLGEDAINSILSHRYKDPLDITFVRSGVTLRTRIFVHAAYVDFELPFYPTVTDCEKVVDEFQYRACKQVQQCGLKEVCQDPSWQDHPYLVEGKTQQLCTPLPWPYPPAPPVSPPLFKVGPDFVMPYFTRSFFYLKADVSTWVGGLAQPDHAIEQTRYFNPEDFEIDPETGAIRLKGALFANLPPPLAPFQDTLEKSLNKIVATSPLPTRADGRVIEPNWAAIHTKSGFREMNYGLYTMIEKDQISFSIGRPVRFAAVSTTYAGAGSKNKGKNLNNTGSRSWADIPDNAEWFRLVGLSNVDFNIPAMTVFVKEGGSWVAQQLYQGSVQQYWSAYEPARHPGHPETPYFYMTNIITEAAWMYNRGVNGDSAKFQSIFRTTPGAFRVVEKKFKFYQDPNCQLLICEN